MENTNDVANAKEVEFYAAQVNAWLATRFELDKSLLTLSAGGVGLMVTIALATGFKSTAALVIYCAAILSFLVCICVVLCIFRRNASHLLEIHRGNVDEDRLLAVLDLASITSFFFGVLLASMLGVSAAVDSYLEKSETKMSEKTSNEKNSSLRESVNNMTEMAPQRIEKSVSGIANMRPQPPQPSPQPAPQPAPSSQSSSKD